MRIGVINVANLWRVRRTFRPGWRIFIIITFLLFVFLRWSAFHQIRDLAQFVTDGSLRLRTLILAVVLLPTLTVAFFRKDDFARLIFALATLFTLITLLPLFLIAVYAIATSPSLDRASMIFLLVMIFIALAFCWDSLIRHCYVLFLSLMPFSRLTAYRQQVLYSLRLWSGQWKISEGSQVVEAGETPHPTPGAYYRLALGGIWFLLGIIIITLALVGLVNAEFLPAIYHLNFSKAWSILRHFQPTSGPSWDTFWAEFLDAMNVVPVLFFGLFCFIAFGYFRTQWQRENIPIYRVSILQHMSPSDVLLLRSFKDDYKFVSRAKNSIWMIPFTAYSWSFTFEQLIVNRLKYLGQVRLLDVQQENKELLCKWWLKVFVNLLGEDRFRKLLILVFPGIWYKLPSKGGVRYYVDAHGDEQKWRQDIEKAMSIARMIIVLLGTTDSLRWEMGRIEQLHLSEKTVFVMPPLILKKNYRARWQQFIDYVCEIQAYDKELLKKINPKRVLAVCVRESALIIITGSRNASSQSPYESAIDVATILTVTDPAQSGKLIPKYLT